MYSHELLVILYARPMPPVARDRPGPEDAEASALAVVAERADDALAVLEEACNGVLHVELDAAVDAVVLERADHFEAGAVADVGESRVLVPAEVSLEDPAVLGAVEERAPGFEFADAVRGLLRVQFGHDPVVEVLPAAHRVGEVDLPAVAVVHVGQRGRHAALGHDGVGLAEEGLADDADGNAGGGSLDRSAQACPPRSDDEDAVLVCLVVGHVECSTQGRRPG